MLYLVKWMITLITGTFLGTSAPAANSQGIYGIQATLNTPVSPSAQESQQDSQDEDLDSDIDDGTASDQDIIIMEEDEDSEDKEEDG